MANKLFFIFSRYTNSKSFLFQTCKIFFIKAKNVLLNTFFGKVQQKFDIHSIIKMKQYKKNNNNNNNKKLKIPS